MAIKTAAELAAACEDVAKNYKTLYIMGCFGAPMTSRNKARYTKNDKYNKKPARVAMINAASADTFGFDCVCLIKGLLWGWSGNQSKTYGGAGYACNGVPDIDAGQMIKACKGVSTDFSTIQVGEAVYTPGHIGLYIGDGLAVECTPAWANGVQITAVHNIGTKAGYNGRRWTKHGRLPYVTYDTAQPEKPATKPTTGATTTKEGCTVKMETLKPGSKHPHVKVLQALLIGNGYSCGKSGADGIYGAATKAALGKYQADHKDTTGKPLTVDYTCGPKTWGALLAQ
jgi:hypothetical protein